MRKIYRLAMAALMVGSALSVQAEAYTYDFNDSELVVNNNRHTLPAGWNHQKDYYFDYNDYEYYYPDYTYVEEGVDGSGALKCVDQTAVGDGYNTGATYDLVITPYVKGAISIDVKRIGTSSSSHVYAYVVSKTGSTWSRSTQLLAEADQDEADGEFHTLTFTLDEPAYVGYRISNAIVDNFSAEEKVDVRQLSVAATNETVGGTSPKCNEENKFTLSFNVTLTNTGDITISPDDEDAKIAICHATNYQGVNKVALETFAIAEAIEPGGSLQMSVSTAVDANVYGDRAPYGVWEQVSDQYKHVDWIKPVAYVPVLKFRDSSGSLVNKTQNYGRVNEPTSRTYRVANSGAAPLVVTNISVPNGFSVDKTSFTVASDEYEEITITLNSTGSGNLVISANGLDDFELGLSGIILDSTKWFQDFEDQYLVSTDNRKWPEGMLAEANWSIKDWSVEDSKVVASYGLNDTERHDLLVTPLLTFEEGETFSFDIMYINYSSAVTVMYSEDRQNWTELRVVENSELTTSKESSYPYHYLCTPIAVNLPAGNYYIAFDANYCYLDHLYGGVKVDVDHDLLLTPSSPATSVMANYQYTAKGVVNNLLAKEEIVNVSLVVDGQTVAVQEVTVPAQDKQNFEISYLPIVANEGAEAKFVLNVDGLEVESTPWTLVVTPEVLKGEAVTPYEESQILSQQGLFASYYKFSQSNVLIPEAFIPVEPGTAITGITVYGTNTCSFTDVPLDLWICTPSDELLEPEGYMPDTDAMTLIVDSKDVPLTKITSADNPGVVMDIDFDEPYVYNGGRLQMFFSFKKGSYSDGFYPLVVYNDDAAMNMMKTRKSDSDVTSVNFSSYNLPIFGYKFDAEPTVLSGVVTSNDRNRPVEGATVAISAVVEEEPIALFTLPVQNTVTYTAVTDENGQYSMEVYQADNIFALSATHAYHLPYTHSENLDLSQGSQVVNFTMDIDAATGIDNISLQNAPKGIFNVNGLRLDAEESELAPGIYIIDGKKVVITRK